MENGAQELLEALIRREHGDDAWRALLADAQASGDPLAGLERGLRGLDQRLRELGLLEQLGDACNRAVEPAEALTVAVAVVCAYAGWAIGQAFMVQKQPPRGISLRHARVWHSADSARFSRFRELAESEWDAPGQGLPNRVLKSGLPELVGQIAEDWDFPRQAAALDAGLHAAFAFPVLIGTEVVAVLEFYAEQAGAPGSEVLRLLAEVGKRLGHVVERVRAREQLLYEAFHDPLTKLPNRALFMEHLQAMLERSRRLQDFHFAVLFLDIDRFHSLNTRLGQKIGEALILATAQRLGSCLRRNDVLASASAIPVEGLIARLGGDEFTIVLEGVRDASSPLRVVERIQRALAQPYHLAGQQVYATASIGIALSASGYDNVHDILRDADTAKVRAKSLGRNRYEIFDQAMGARALSALRAEAELRNAVDQGEFRLVYQPVVDIGDMRICGFEALLRWQHPERGELVPAAFMHIAEQAGLLRGIGKWVLREACAQARVWLDARLVDAEFSMAVNISGDQLADDDFVEYLREVLYETGLPARNLRVELTEAVILADMENAIQSVQKLRNLGLQVSLDDFGTGQASLNCLRNIPVNTLKLDRSLISGLPVRRENRYLLEAILAMAHVLDMDVVAEGVETYEEFRQLQGLQCEYAQGHHFFHPMEAAKIEGVLHRQGRRQRITNDETVAYNPIIP